jgi:hypothetical protein
MSGCVRCGSRCRGRLCRPCEADERAAERAANRPDDHPECPTCGGARSGEGVECYRCRRGEGIKTDGGYPDSGGERWLGRGTWLVDRSPFEPSIGVITGVQERDRKMASRLSIQWRPHTYQNISLLGAIENLRRGVWEVDDGE